MTETGTKLRDNSCYEWAFDDPSISDRVLLIRIRKGSSSATQTAIEESFAESHQSAIADSALLRLKEEKKKKEIEDKSAFQGKGEQAERLSRKRARQPSLESADRGGHTPSKEEQGKETDDVEEEKGGEEGPCRRKSAKLCVRAAGAAMAAAVAADTAVGLEDARSDTKIHVSSLVLISNSDFFKTMLHSRFAETSNKSAPLEIHVSDNKERALVVELIRWMYTRKITVSDDDLLAWYVLADKYGVNDAVVEARKRLLVPSVGQARQIISTIACTNTAGTNIACTTTAAAAPSPVASKSCIDGQLISIAMSSFVDHFSDLDYSLRTDMPSAMSLSEDELVLLIKSDDIQPYSENVVFTLAHLWLCKNGMEMGSLPCAETRDLCVRIMAGVRFEYCSGNFLATVAYPLVGNIAYPIEIRERVAKTLCSIALSSRAQKAFLKAREGDMPVQRRWTFKPATNSKKRLWYWKDTTSFASYTAEDLAELAEDTEIFNDIYVDGYNLRIVFSVAETRPDGTLKLQLATTLANKEPMIVPPFGGIATFHFEAAIFVRKPADANDDDNEDDDDGKEGNTLEEYDTSAFSTLPEDRTLLDSLAVAHPKGRFTLHPSAATVDSTTAVYGLHDGGTTASLWCKLQQPFVNDTGNLFIGFRIVPADGN